MSNGSNAPKAGIVVVGSLNADLTIYCERLPLPVCAPTPTASPTPARRCMATASR